MNFIKNMVEGKKDELVHLQFQKFSKGEFKNRAVVKVTCSKGSYTIQTTNEFANELVKSLALKLGNNKANITGAIITTQDLKTEISYKSIKQFMGIKQYVVDSEFSGKELVDMLNKIPKAFFALSFKAGEDELKIKAKAPKSAKPSTKTDEVPKPDFCKLITKDISFVKDFVFEANDFKKAEIKHNFLIKDIIVPKGETDPLKMRENAIRKGILVREADIDGKKFKKEINFEA